MHGRRHPAELELRPNHLGTPLSWNETETGRSGELRPANPIEVTQMVTNRIQHSDKKPVKQGAGEIAPEANKIGASTPFDFSGKNLTPYGGLLPVATMLEKLGFQAVMEETVLVKRLTKVMSGYQFLLAMMLGLYIGFSRLNQLRFIARDPILTGVLKIVKLPPQCTLWRFLGALHGSVAQQILSVQEQMRRRVWEAANVKLKTATLDTDTTVHTLYGQQMGARKSYNPKNKGKKSYQPILTFLAETREYVAGELRNGDRPTGKQIARHLRSAFQSLPEGVEKLFARADSGFYCWEAVEAYEQAGCQFIVVARKTSRLVEELKGGRMEAVTEDRRRCRVRIPLPAGRMGPCVPLRGATLSEEAGRSGRGPGRAISIVRDQRVHLPGLGDQSERPDRSGGVVLQPAGWSGEPDQRSQQRRGLGGTSLPSVRCQRQSFPVGDAGLQRELLAHAVQPGARCRHRHAPSHDAGHGAAAIPVRGGEDLASCGKDRGELQRPLRGARHIPATDGSITCDWSRLWAGDGDGVDVTPP